jgi:acyl-CoA reductase-like NAD-dependent aldehyde dehydrogenase
MALPEKAFSLTCIGPDVASALPEALAGKLGALSGNAQKWHEMKDNERAALVRRCRSQLATLDMEWVADSMRCNGLEPSNPDTYKTFGMDGFVFIAIVAERLDKIADALEGKLKEGKAPERELPNGGPAIYKMGAVAQSAPGATLEVWSDPSRGDTDPTTAATPGVCLALGAGNQNFLSAVDVVELAIWHKKCVLLKHHPLREFTMAPFKHLFAPLLEAGFYDQCCDADAGGAHAALISHASIKHIHMTGGPVTHGRIHEALVAAKRENDVLFTSELGCVTPWIVCPGARNGGVWSQSELDDQAAMLTSGFKGNCSMNCLSPKVLVLPPASVWPQRDAFLESLKKKIATTPQVPPYYPGAHRRYANFEREYPEAEKIEAPPSQEAGKALAKAEYERLGQDISPLPSLLLDVGSLGDKKCLTYALQNEAFAPVLAIATVACTSAKEFPLAAAHAVNQHIFGTLSCNLIYPDERDAAMDEVLNVLNYGAISVNFWAAFMYMNPCAPWGGAPGSYKTTAPCSGLGFIGNAAHIPSPVKAVGIGKFVNKAVVMDTPIPYIVADALRIVVSGKRFAFVRIMGLLFSRFFGLLKKPLPAARAA